MRHRFVIALFGAACALTGATSCSQETTKPPVPAEEYVDLGQGWSADQRSRWYRAGQGSRLLPFAWLQALEQPGTTVAPFLDRAYIESFRYLWPNDGGDQTLPVGFAKDVRSDRLLTFSKLQWKAGQTDKEPWVGLTCSACHTGELTFGDKKLRVYGGPTFADAQSFLEALNKALAETESSDAKFDRFARNVLKGGDLTDPNRQSLRAALKKLSTWQNQMAALNDTPLRYGPGRLDAFGYIYNKVAKLAAGAVATGNPPDAPVSYPFLWNVPQLDKVQWNGIADNKPFKFPVTGEVFHLSALGRNTGEVVGVFADVHVKAGAPLAGFASSVDVANLDSIEVKLLGTLKPPRWPDEVFGKPKEPLVSEGRTLFATSCKRCHEPLLDRNNLKTPITTGHTRLVPVDNEPAIGTDPWMACNAYAYEADAGLLRDTPSGYYFGPKLPQVAPLSNMLGATVAGALGGQRGEVIRAAARAFFGVKRPPKVAFDTETILEGFPTGAVARTEAKKEQLAKCLTDAPKVEILGYQSRPLNGIWATAPYLHNGSVASLYELLLPPDQRKKAFYMGSRAFDPDDVGVKQPTNNTDGLFKFETSGEGGSAIDGNANGGHDYGNAGFTAAQRRALVEYMKTL